MSFLRRRHNFPSRLVSLRGNATTLGIVPSSSSSLSFADTDGCAQHTRRGPVVAVSLSTRSPLLRHQSSYTLPPSRAMIGGHSHHHHRIMNDGVFGNNNVSATKFAARQRNNDGMTSLFAGRQRQPSQVIKQTRFSSSTFIGREERWFGTSSPSTSNSYAHHHDTNNKQQRRQNKKNHNHVQNNNPPRQNKNNHNHMQNNNPPKGFLDVRKFQTVEQAARIAFDNADDLTPRSLSAFWTRISQLMTEGTRGFNTTSKEQEQHLMHNHLVLMFSKTVGEMEKFGARDLSQTALALAKISNVVDNPRFRDPQRELHSKHGISKIFSDILVGRQSQQQRQLFQSIADASVPLLSKFDVQGLSNLAYANAIVDSLPVLEDGRTLFDHIAEESIPRLKHFTPQNLSNLAWSFQRSGTSHPSLFAKVANATIVSLDRQREDFEPQSISNIVLAFAKSGETHPKLFERVAHHMVTELDDLDAFNPQELSNVVWAFAKAGEANPRLFEEVAIHILVMDRLDSFIPQALANIAWAFVKVGESDARLFGRLADHCVAPGNLDYFDPQALAITVWAFAKAEISHPSFSEKVADHIVALDDLNSFAPQNLSNIIWAFSNAEELDPRVFEKVADHIGALDDLDRFDMKELCYILWVFAKNEVSNPELFEKVANHMIDSDNLRGFDPQALTNTVWAFAKTEQSHPKLFRKIAKHVIALDNLDSFTPQHLFNMVWAFAIAEESNPRLFQKVARQIFALDNLNEFIPQNLANTVWAFAKAEEPNPRLFKKVARHIIGLDDLTSFHPQALGNIIWAFSIVKEVQPRLFAKVADHILELDNLHSFNPIVCSQILRGFAAAKIVHDPLVEKLKARSKEDTRLDLKSKKMLRRAYDEVYKSSKQKEIAAKKPSKHHYRPTNDGGTNVSQFFDDDIRDMLAERSRAKYARDFETADGIQADLNSAGVFVHDVLKEWRADGKPYPYESNFRRSGGDNGGERVGRNNEKQLEKSRFENGEVHQSSKRNNAEKKPSKHDYRPSNDGGRNISNFSEEKVRKMLAERSRAKFGRDFEKADSIQAELNDGGVFVHDVLKEWRADGVPYHYESRRGGGDGNVSMSGSRNSEKQLEKPPFDER